MISNSRAPEIGDSHRFLPAAFIANGRLPMTLPLVAPDSLYVTGTVVQVHKDHRWFRVEYQTSSGTLHECFKF